MNTCPHCQGKGELEGLVCGHGRIKRGLVAMPCTLCKGTGEVDDAHLAKVEAGQKMRAERLARYVTQRERAAELGMDEVAYSRLENGRDP